MRTITIDLFGALREAESAARLQLDSDAQTIAALRADVEARVAHWPANARALLPRCAFASTTTVLRDGDALPADGRLALLPPVSGG
jgi:molybdopterin synthase sulfur carrier subunit